MYVYIVFICLNIYIVFEFKCNCVKAIKFCSSWVNRIVSNASAMLIFEVKHFSFVFDIFADDILHMLSSAMSLLRRCRVNAALTIQLFSQLFHSINMWLFNKLVANTPAAQALCCRQWGIRFRTRLAMVETWAEKQVCWLGWWRGKRFGINVSFNCNLQYGWNVSTVTSLS